MVKSQGDWRKYLLAARRKVEIALYHRDQLELELTSSALPGSELPPISVQAHFEGVIFSLMAAVDHVAQAVNSARGMKLSQGDLVRDAFSALGETVPEVSNWYSNKIGRDLRCIRVRAVHYSYTKNPTVHRWWVESVGKEKDYGESRELLSYASAGVEYGRRLVDLLEVIERDLARAASDVSS